MAFLPCSEDYHWQATMLLAISENHLDSCQSMLKCHTLEALDESYHRKMAFAVGVSKNIEILKLLTENYANIAYLRRHLFEFYLRTGEAYNMVVYIIVYAQIALVAENDTIKPLVLATNLVDDSCGNHAEILAYRRLRLCRLIFSQGYKPHEYTSLGFPVFLTVIEMGDPKLVKLFIDNGADCTADALFTSVAVTPFKREIFDLIYKKSNIHIDVRDRKRRSLLMHAGSVEAAKALIDLGASVKCIDAQGCNALFYADTVAHASLLVKAGIKIDQVDYAFQSVIDKHKSEPQMVAYLQAVGAS